jgi:N-acetylneuraminic acid mutarotase
MDVSPAAFEPRSGHAAVVLGDELFIIGGEGRSGSDITSLNDAWKINFGEEGEKKKKLFIHFFFLLF